MMLFADFPNVVRNRRFLGILSALSLLVAFLACGVPHQTAESVDHIFYGQASSLQQKVASVCDYLRSGKRGPTMDGVSYTQDACVNAGSKAQNLSTLKQFAFSAIESSGVKFNTENNSPNQSNLTNVIKFRAELWLNRSILGVAGNLIHELRKGAISNIIVSKKADMKIIKGPLFDPDIFRVQTLYKFDSTPLQNGSIDVHNYVLVDAMKISNAFVTSIQFNDEPDSKKSFVKRGKAFVFIIPHAQDVYIDIMIEAEFHSFGVGSTVESQAIAIVRDYVESKLRAILDN